MATEQPFYKLCEYCLHYQHTVKSGKDKICTRYPNHIERLPDDTCGEWLCARCWIPWDMVTQNEAEPQRIYIVDHTKCPQVKFETRNFAELEGFEDD